VGLSREEGGGGDEACIRFEESQEGRSWVELEVAAAKVRGCQDEAPRLADGGCADEPGRLLWRKAEEDLLDEVVHQDRRRQHCAAEARVWVGKRGVRTVLNRFGRLHRLEVIQVGSGILFLRDPYAFFPSSWVGQLQHSFLRPICLFLV
jgi:hypothetical protein